MSSSHVKTAYLSGVKQAFLRVGMVKEASQIGASYNEKVAVDRYEGGALGGALGSAAGAGLAHLFHLNPYHGAGLGLLAGAGLGALLGHPEDPHARLKAIAADAGKGALALGVPGALAGAALSDDRGMGALKGGLSAGALGAVGGGVHGAMSHDMDKLNKEIRRLRAQTGWYYPSHYGWY